MLPSRCLVKSIFPKKNITLLLWCFLLAAFLFSWTHLLKPLKVFLSQSSFLFLIFYFLCNIFSYYEEFYLCFADNALDSFSFSKDFANHSVCYWKLYYIMPFFFRASVKIWFLLFFIISTLINCKSYCVTKEILVLFS